MYKFPVYRKYSNGLSYFKIESETRLIELKKMPGDAWEKFTLNAQNYFDRVHIKDLIDCSSEHCQKIEIKDFQKIMEKTTT